jgi:hypothetical protein
MSRAIPQLPLHATVVCTGTTLGFTFYTCHILYHCCDNSVASLHVQDIFLAVSVSVLVMSFCCFIMDRCHQRHVLSDRFPVS